MSGGLSSSMNVTEGSFLKNRIYISFSADHFFVDILNSSRALLVAIIAVEIGLSNAQVGLVLLLYNIGSALSQPFFGVLADRHGSKWLILGGVSWMVLCFFLAAISTSWTALILLTVAGFGSGAFHPAGTKYASEASRSARTQATGVFFAAGQSGLFAGPIVAGLLLDWLERPGYLIMPALAGLMMISGWWWAGSNRRRRGRVSIADSPVLVSFPAEKRPAQYRRTLLSLMAIILATSTVSTATINLGSKLFTEKGYSAFYVGLITGIYMLGSAGGGIVGGILADRHGRRLPILVGVLGAILPFYLYIPASYAARPLLLLMAGFFGGMPHSVLVIAAQSLLPGRRAFASGLTLGLMFFSGAIGTYLVGIIADQSGLAPVLQNLSLLLLLAALAVLFLPNRVQKDGG